MPYRNLIDQHVHTDNSFDGCHSVMFICEKALEYGLRGVAFTDHLDIDSKNISVRKITVPSYIETMKARSAFTGRLIVSAGIELGQPIYNKELADSAVNGLKYDIILASIHNLPDMPDFYFLDYSQYDPVDLLEQYFQKELELARWNGFDSLAHLTYPLRYIIGEQHIDVNMKRFDDIIAEIFETLIKNQKSLEINVSGLRQPLKDMMPGEAYVRLYKKMGGKYITVGSDAHKAYDVGKDCGRALKMAYDCGFREFTLYERREPMQITII